jgi:hypothetical protein
MQNFMLFWAVPKTEATVILFRLFHAIAFPGKELS